ncbi:MAG: hypothetical protein KDC90_10025 [Ignavibacteriae bacterium]|nr:hypothetical protein [Ignavibacteriota bacterium]
METRISTTYFFLKPFSFILFFIIGFLLNSCASSKDLKVSEFNFIYDGNDYTIRSSYCPNNPKSCNQLIGKNFVAADLNQDRIIDKIIKGNIPLSKAQEIYDYCLNTLEKQGKVSQIDMKNSIYSFSEGVYIYEIKSFTTDNNNYFNQFIVKERAGFDEYDISLFLDKEADGTLDELLKGSYQMKLAQSKYKLVLEKGLADNKIKKINGSIIVILDL